jgi:hypothetical protein
MDVLCLFSGIRFQAELEKEAPPPWTVEELDACFVVRDHNGQQLAYVYLRGGARRSAAKLLTKDGAPRIAANIAKLPELFAPVNARGRRGLGPLIQKVQ